MSKHISKLILFTFCLFTCTACFDFEENILLKKDGSGKFTFQIDMGKSKSMMSLFQDMPKSVESNDFEMNTVSTNKIEEAFSGIHENMISIPGITNSRVISDTSNNKFGISFDFKNVEALNKAMNTLFEKDSTTTQEEVIYYEFKENQFIRNDTLNASSLLGKTSQFKIKNTTENSSMNSFLGLSKLFEDVTYTTNYTFEKSIASAKNGEAKLSENLKSISTTCYPFFSLNDTTIKKCSISNTITFK